MVPPEKDEDAPRWSDKDAAAYMGWARQTVWGWRGVA